MDPLLPTAVPDPFAGFPPLKNTYVALRHGHSVPQERGVIIVKPDEAADPLNGLTDYGRGQVRRGAREAKEAGILPVDAIIISSDASCALQTALLVRDVLVAEPPRVDPLARERDFGQFEFKSNAAYPQIWAADALDDTIARKHVEPARAVRDRFARFILACEAAWSGKTVVIVSGADFLHIGETAFRRLPAGGHAAFPRLANGQARRLVLVA